MSSLFLKSLRYRVIIHESLCLVQQLDPQLLLAFLPQLESYNSSLKSKKSRSIEETYIFNSLTLLLDYLRKDYLGTIAKINNLTSHGEIVFDLLYAVMVPRTILVTECPSTGEPRALQLVSATKVKTMGTGFYDLLCESIDAVDHANDDATTNGWANGTGNSVDQELNKAGFGKSFGRVRSRVLIGPFKGTVPINSLDAYPIKYHVKEDELRKKLLARGEKWVGLKGIHHMQYKASASLMLTAGNGCKKVVRYNVNSRIMVDRGRPFSSPVYIWRKLIFLIPGNFKRLNPNYELPVIKQSNTDAQQNNLPYDPYDRQLQAQDPSAYCHCPPSISKLTLPLFFYHSFVG